MHLTLFIHPSGHHQASWRHPRAQADAGVNLEHYTQLAQAAEAACLDAVFFGDNQMVRAGAPEAVSRVAQFVANFEPLTLASALIARTSRVGFICTATTSFNYPYQVARKFASMDHLSAGRMGWNVVTSGMPEEAKNFNRDKHFDHEVRYERAAEFVEVCEGLWNSWDDDAFPRDKESGIFSIPEKMHVLDHEGEHFRVKGPLNVPRSPQGRPVLVQAGASPTGMAFAARIADMVFTTPQTIDEGVAMYRQIKEAVAQAGRDPDEVRVAPGLAFVTGATRADADREWETLQSLLHIDVAINILQLKLGGIDLSPYDLDEPLPASANPNDGRGYFERWYDVGEREGMTLGELAGHAAGSLMGLSVRGSGVELADLMQEWVQAGAADGFNLMPAFLPGGLDDFVTYVLPELRRRGLFREQYTGHTLRDHLGLSMPTRVASSAG